MSFILCLFLVLSIVRTDGLKLLSPCKVNLFLRILGRRPSGFHDLASLFQTISLSDEMTFSERSSLEKSDNLLCSDITLEVDDNNLVIKALNLMRSKTGIDKYFDVSLTKNIPMQAGLGGGSGNAATAMYAFNKLCGYPATLEQLLEWSGDIGSDITFFFSSGTAYCTGRGEILTPLPALPFSKDIYVHIFKPNAGLSTGVVFNTLDLDNLSPYEPQLLLEKFTKFGALKASQENGMINDLEPPAYTCNHNLLKLKEYIQDTIDSDSSSSISNNGGNGIGGTMMSGSGTSIYSLTNGPLETNTINQILEKFPDVRYFPCHFLSKENNVESWYE